MPRKQPPKTATKTRTKARPQAKRLTPADRKARAVKVKMREARERAIATIATAKNAEEKQAARDVLLGETIKVSQSWYGSAIYDTNPDDLIRAKGRGLKTYQAMLADPYVKAGLRQLKSTILAPGWKLVPPKNPTDREKEAHAFMVWAMNEMDTPMTDVLLGLLNALEMGFSIAEKVLAEVEDGPWAGLWRYARIKDKDPNWIAFDLDEYATVKSITNTLDIVGGKNIDTRRVVLFINDPKYSNPWGNSELRAAHRAWVLKDTFWKLWAMYGERNVTPMVIGTYPAGDDEAQSALEEIVENIQFGTAVTLPKIDGLDIRALQLGSMRGTMDWEAAIEMQNKELLIAVVGSFLSAEEGRNVGSRSATDSHIGIMGLVAGAIMERLTAVAQRQMIAPLVRINYGPDVRPPQFQFNESRSTDRVVDAQILNYLFNMDYPIPVSYIRNRFNIPAPEEGEDVLRRGQTGFAQQSEPLNRIARLAEPESPYSRPLNHVEKLAEPELKRRLAWEAGVKAHAAPMLRSAYKGVFKQVRRWVERQEKAFEKRDPSAASKIPVNVGPVKEAIEAMALNGIAVGYGHVIDFARRRGLVDLAKKNPELREEIEEAKKGAVRLEKFEDDDFDDPEQILSAEELERFFRERYPMTRSDYRKMMDRFGDRAESTAVTAAGLSKTDIQRSVQSLMVQAIGEGMSLQGFMSKLDSLEARYVEPVYNRVGTKGQKVLDYHAENIFRTNLASGYAAGKRAALEEPLMKILMPAQQYTAVLDDRTTEFCREMDGRVFRTDDPIWGWVMIPAHFECRADILPIDIGTFTNDMLSEYPSIGPQEGFGAIPGVPAMMAELPEMNPVRIDASVRDAVAAHRQATMALEDVRARVSAEEATLQDAENQAGTLDEQEDGDEWTEAEMAVSDSQASLKRLRKIEKDRTATIKSTAANLRKAADRAARLAGADRALVDELLAEEGVQRK